MLSFCYNKTAFLFIETIKQGTKLLFKSLSLHKLLKQSHKY